MIDKQFTQDMMRTPVRRLNDIKELKDLELHQVIYVEEDKSFHMVTLTKFVQLKEN